LDATSLTLDRKTGVFLQIYHYNYDFPNRLPNNCINIYLSDCEIIDPSIFQYSGSSILDLTIDSSDNGKLSLHFDLEILSKGYYQREKLEAFKASIIYISEK
jgi:hypothetical protein